MQEETFHKILGNTATENEKNEFFRLLENDSEKQEEFLKYKNLYALSHLNPNNYQSQQHESFNRFWNIVQPQKRQRKIQLWMRYAAIFVVASTLGFMADYILNTKTSENGNQHIVYSSEKGSISTIHLDDGSSIWLSSGTKLVIDKNRKGEILTQLNGEAYFDLKPNPDRKLTVDLGYFKVRDIGTKFNIRAYQSEQTITASLDKGQINLIKNSGEPVISVKPGEFVEYDKSDNKLSISQKDPSIVSAWKDGKFVFIDQPLTEICKELENWYNVEIRIEDPKLAVTRYTSVVKRSTTVQMVLKILAVTDHINYEITDKKDGRDIIKIMK